MASISIWHMQGAQKVAEFRWMALLLHSRCTQAARRIQMRRMLAGHGQGCDHLTQQVDPWVWLRPRIWAALQSRGAPPSGQHQFSLHHAVSLMSSHGILLRWPASHLQ